MRINCVMVVAMIMGMISAAHAEDAAHDHGGGVYHNFVAEAQVNSDDTGALSQEWDVKGWVGTDIQKLILRSEGAYHDARLDETTLWALYSRTLSDYWDAQLGVRQDVGGYPTTSLVMGFDGVAPYFFETEAHMFISHRGDLTARLKIENEILATQKIVLQPYWETHLSAARVHNQRLGAGVTAGKVGLKTRYEVNRNWAPYVDVHYGRKFGETSLITQAEGGRREETVFALGLRLMF